MPLKKKSLLLFRIFFLSNTLFGCLTNIVKAETYDNNPLDLSASKLLENSVTSIRQEFPFKFSRFSDIKISQNVEPLEVTPLQESGTESGSPSLRRQPTGGERFEPTRIPLKIPFPKKTYKATPSISIINPSAYGASWGSAGIGLGFQERVRFDDTADGVIGLGFGLGDPRKNVGAQIGISLVDVSSPFRDGAINLKIHRRLPQDFAVAFGVQGLATWGNTDGGSSVYGAFTKRFKLRKDRTKAFSEFYTTLGLGGGQFRSESDINNGNETVGVFSSLGIKIAQPIGLVTEWTGQDLTIGTPLVLFRQLPLVIVPAVTDITGTAGDGARFVLGVGYSFTF